MANWLEEEEHRKSQLLQREELVHTHLRSLYDLCDRVNGVKPGSLRVIGFEIEGLRTYWILPGRVRGKRGLRLGCQSEAVITIDAIIDEDHIRHSFQEGTYSINREFVVLRTTCSLHDLSEWREDQILNAIQWMMLESETIKGNIPGTEVTTTDVAAKVLLTGVDFTHSPTQLPSHGRVILRNGQFMTEHAAAIADANAEDEARRQSEERARRQADTLERGRRYEQLKRANSDDWVRLGMMNGGLFGLVGGFFISCSVQHVPVATGAWFRTLVLGSVISAIIGAVLGAFIGRAVGRWDS